MRLLSRLKLRYELYEAFSKITNFLAKIENNFTKRGRGSQISTPIYRGHRPGVSCVKIGVQTVSDFDKYLLVLEQHVIKDKDDKK